jgi:energy-coupling factor transporter ATP-binding protein EcfA2
MSMPPCAAESVLCQVYNCQFAGTGFLHVVQIFAYLVLFRPSIILIDEPECHLHPTLQTKLTRELRRRVSQLGCTALITTHSPFVARGLPLGSNVVWVKSGGITEAKESELIKRLLGWGALDKPILLCTEDSTASSLEEILKQAPEFDNQVSVFPFNGVSTIGHAKVIAELRSKLGNSHKVIVHRDRDGMTDDECLDWTKAYSEQGIVPWITQGSDIESYFCDPGYLASIFEQPIDVLQAGIQKIIDDNTPMFSNTFAEKRKQVNRRYDKTGGSPSTDDLRESWHWSRWIKGKDLLAKVRDWVRDELKLDEKTVGRASENYVVAVDLMRHLAKASE